MRLPDLSEMARRQLGIELGGAQVAAMETFASRLLDWNTRVNLTAITDPAEIEVKHFLDSLTLLLIMNDPAGEQVVDVGTGAGFPGLVLKIACPRMPITLLEATKKKAEFCRMIVRDLDLQQAQVVNQRAEQIGQDPVHRAAYRWAVARAVARLDVLAEYLLPLLKVGGFAIAQKGETAVAEAQQAEPAVELLGGRLVQIRPISLPRVAETRHLVVLEKIAATPDRYPRRPGMPAKRPLGDQPGAESR